MNKTKNSKWWKIIKWLYKNNQEFFLIKLLSEWWKYSILYNIKDVFTLPFQELEYKIAKFEKRKYKIVSKKNLLFCKYFSFFNKKPNQEFRNFFKLKNISKENFDKYLIFLERNFSNIDKEKLKYENTKFEEYLNNSKYWKSDFLSKDNIKKIALADAIYEICIEIISKNKNSLK